MKAKINVFLQQMLRSPKEFPVEMVMGICFFIIAVINTEHRLRFATDGVDAEILSLFVPLTVLTYWLNRLRKRQTEKKWRNVCTVAYILSGFLFLPLMTLYLDPFIKTTAFVFTYILAGILLVVGTRWMDNRGFAAHVLHVTTQMIIGCAIMGLLNLVVMAIVASFLYIFGIDTPRHLFEHIFFFIWFVLAPQVCFTLTTQGEDEVNEPVKPLRIVLDYILSPAVIIYTVILYLYFFTIVAKWDLPKGNVAWLITGFIAAALIGRLMQYVLVKRHYDWFYKYLPWIAIPPIVMYWIGSVYRISVYSFTESRFYLIVAGVLMTLFIVMLIWKRTRKFQLMALIAAGAIVVFTYIPGISAKSIGFRCQLERFHKMVSELKLMDAKTGKLPTKIDLDAINADSVKCAQYRELSSIIKYVRDDMGYAAFEQQYGQWKYYAYNFNEGNSIGLGGVSEWVSVTAPIDLGNYNILIASGDYNRDSVPTVYYDQEDVIVERDDTELLRYPINAFLRQHPEVINQPNRLCVYRNDSLLLVLGGIEVTNGKVTHVNTGEFLLFGKKQ